MFFRTYPFEQHTQYFNYCNLSFNKSFTRLGLAVSRTNIYTLDEVLMTSEVVRRSVSKHFRKITNKNNNNNSRWTTLTSAPSRHPLPPINNCRWRRDQTCGQQWSTLRVIHITAFLSALLWFPSIPLSFPCSVFDSSAARGTISSTAALTLTFCGCRWRDSITEQQLQPKKSRDENKSFLFDSKMNILRMTSS